MVDLIPLSEQSFDTVVPYRRARAPSVSPDLIVGKLRRLFPQPPFFGLFHFRLVIEILSGVGPDVEERFLEQECLTSQNARFEVDQLLRVESLSVITGFEMQVRAGVAARRTAQTDDLSCLDPFAALHEPFGEVSVVGFRPLS